MSIPYQLTMRFRALLLVPLLVCLVAQADEEGVIEVSILKLNNVEYEVGDELPEWVTALTGHQVRISGYMRNGTTEGETRFDLTNDSCGCGTSKLQHFVRVTLVEGQTTFRPSELTLVGEFSSGEVEDEDGFVESIFQLSIDSLPE